MRHQPNNNRTNEGGSRAALILRGLHAFVACKRDQGCRISLPKKLVASMSV